MVEDGALTHDTDSTRSAPRQQRGLCARGGEICYLCEQPIREGDAAVFYDDAAFWDQPVFYHGDCWSEADLGAKEFGGKSIHEGTVIVLPEVRCSRCGEPIDPGDTIVRVRGGGQLGGGGGSILPRVFHSECFEPGRA